MTWFEWMEHGRPGKETVKNGKEAWRDMRGIEGSLAFSFQKMREMTPINKEGSFPSRNSAPYSLTPHLYLGMFLSCQSAYMSVVWPNFYRQQYFPQMHPSLQTLPLKRKPRAVSTFLKKTYQLLNDPQNQPAVRWSPSGIGFIVLDEQAFSKDVLPKYFKHSNYSSFVRQLNMYNFHKIRENNAESYFHHQSFDRDDQAKLADIRRKPQKKKRKSEDSEEEAGSQQEEQMLSRQPAFVKRIKEEQRAYREVPIEVPAVERMGVSVVKVEQKNTRHFVSEEEHQHSRASLRQLEQADDDKLSINNDIISERAIPRLPTRELINPSNSNLFPFGAGKGQTSTFCLFY